MNEKELIERDKSRDIGTELLEAIRQINAGNWARKTTFEPQEDGSILRRVVTRDGTVERETRITGARADLMTTRARYALSQTEFARMIGVSKRTIEKWEQGSTDPSGAARQLLRLTAHFPDTLKRLASLA
ncbi:MAG: helix-turn-helix domain-containing protein [Candidatus Accumulibacter sp.]|jgi:putative transcriptional regulator|nr:helix-turn-helix domain-containing protein [Accumulibacter sp.]